jgi:outer membrane protein, heavy metal efflux system
MKINQLFSLTWHWSCQWAGVSLFVLGYALSSQSIAERHVYEEQNLNNAAQPLFNEKINITLLEAVQLALQHNPELASFAKEIQALEGTTLQAGLLPNPRLQIDLEDLGTRTDITPGGTFTAIRIGQLIETGGKRLARRTAASLNEERAERDYEARTLDLIALVANIFTDILAGQARLQLAQDNSVLAQKVVDAAKKRVQAGKAPPIEETRAKVALATAKIELEQAQRDLNAFRKQLTLLWGNPAPKFKHALGDLESLVKIPDLDTLTERVRVNPAVLSSQANLAQRKANLKLQQALRLPDITVSAGIRRYAQELDELDSGVLNDTTALVGISVPLPLFDRNQGNILEAHQRVDQAEDQWEATDLRLRSLLAQTYEGLLSAQNEIRVLQDEILPGAKEAFKTARRGYELGRFNFLTMLDAQRALFQNQALYVRALANYQRLVNEIERLIAAPIENASN